MIAHRGSTAGSGAIYSWDGPPTSGSPTPSAGDFPPLARCRLRGPCRLGPSLAVGYVRAGRLQCGWGLRSLTTTLNNSRAIRRRLSWLRGRCLEKMMTAFIDSGENVPTDGLITLLHYRRWSRRSSRWYLNFFLEGEHPPRRASRFLAENRSSLTRPPSRL